MRRKTSRVCLPNCYWCGQWVGWKAGYYTWVDYGSVMDLEPPDPEFAHTRCWKTHESHQALLNQWTWSKPQYVTQA